MHRLSTYGEVIVMATSDSSRDIRWPLATGLGLVALMRPVLNIFGVMDEVKPAGPVVATVAISAVWVVTILLARAPRPVLTLVVAGLSYGVLAIALSGIVSPIKDGELRGPLATPIAIVPVLTVNALWGLLTGLVAAGLRRVTRRPRDEP